MTKVIKIENCRNCLFMVVINPHHKSRVECCTKMEVNHKYIETPINGIHPDCPLEDLPDRLPDDRETIKEIAKCKDCWFIQPIYHGKRKRHFCNNHNSKYHKAQITLNDLVCDKWQLIGDENQQK